MTLLIEAALVLVLASAGKVDAAQAESNPRAGPIASRQLRGGTVAPGAAGVVAVEAVVAAVRADAAQQAGIEPQHVRLLGADALTWSDGSLGCAQPGRVYTQALVPGWRIRVRAGENDLNYHASQRGQWLQCPAGRATPPAPAATPR